MTYTPSTSSEASTELESKYYYAPLQLTYTVDELQIATGFTPENGLGFLAERQIYPVVDATYVPYNDVFNTIVYTYVVTSGEAIETATVTPISLADAKEAGKVFFREQYSLLVEKTIEDSGYKPPALVAAASQPSNSRGADLGAVITNMQTQIQTLDGFLVDVDNATTNDEIQELVESVDTVEYTVLEVTVSGGVFYIDGAQQPALTFEVGKTWRFNQNDATNAGHPLRIYADAAKTREVTVSDDVYGTPGSAGSMTSWTPLASGTYYYQCGVHAAMGGTITVS